MAFLCFSHSYAIFKDTKGPNGFSYDDKLLGQSRSLGISFGDILRMPGLSKTPAAYHIDIDDDGNIMGISAPGKDE